MLEPRTHVMFNPSDAAALERALKAAGYTDEVLRPFDDFSFGPIATDDADRSRWIDDELGVTDWAEITELSRAFLAAS